MDALLLSRLQFALNISFHILFPTITIALGWFLFYFKLRSNLSGHPVWMRIYRFWVRVFALTFALGVVSGVTMSFQFGTNWPGFMEKAGNIAGPLLGYEVLTAFFLEATFLGIMLFGMRRVPNWLHTLATFVVAAGTTLSAFWILSLNSWLHTPQGHEVIDGVIYAKDWSAIIFNPSFPYRFSHMLLASGLTASFLIAGLSAYRLLIGDNKIAPKLALKTATYTAAVLIPLQILAGDMHGLNTLDHQPQKVAAMEGVWETEQGAPLLLFAIPDEQERTNHAELAIPNLASFILTHELDGEIKGLNEFRGEHPPVAPVFYSFRVMVGMGILMLFAAWAGSYYLFRRGELPDWLGKLFIAMSFSGWVATLAGWYVTEVGRQPYLVSGVLRTADAVTGLPPQNIGLSFALYAVIYAVLMVAYIRTLTLMCRKSVGIEEISKGDADERHTNKLDIASGNA
ncbi:cytochrome ubiquinol oxidase subunit I [Alteromonas alba]|uniref:Cytochrome ubiquinol oxidase subunit I n=1 Tax=Alteromonas alba TaxID=2079529 RepID=A0A2S9VB35_9ALTE|nr:cytochrome ubiquinol oxidase subunit I [Alteromonas alba]PRO73525.1 cytochrome ubiquinol oxidase subunit I [Alteromonas alba]